MRLWLLSLLLVFADWCLLVGLWVAWPSDRVWWVVLPQGFTLKCDFVAGAGVGDEVQISWVGGGAAAPPAADHSHVKQVHVECKANKDTAPARGPAGGGVDTQGTCRGEGGVDHRGTRRRGGGNPEAKHKRRGGGRPPPPGIVWDG